MIWKPLPAALLGIGVGIAVGSRLDKTTIWYGIAAAVIGVVWGVLASHSDTDAVPPRRVTASEPPNLAGLGGRVEQILRLAKEQAANQVDAAERKAERIVAEAQAHADGIRATASDESGDV